MSAACWSEPHYSPMLISTAQTFYQMQQHKDVCPRISGPWMIHLLVLRFLCILFSLSLFTSAGLWSFQLSSWARPWPRGWKPPYCLPRRQANHKIMPKLCVKSSSTHLTQRYACSHLASSYQKVKQALTCNCTNWNRGDSKTFLYRLSSPPLLSGSWSQADASWVQARRG